MLIVACAIRCCPRSNLHLQAEAEGAEDGGIAVSVHVRAGDSCDVATRSHTAHTWAFWPFDWNGAKGADWLRVRRFCVHPSVHLAALRGVMATRRVRSVLLATDSAEAAALFKSELSSDDVELQVASFNRGALSMHGNGGTHFRPLRAP